MTNIGRLAKLRNECNTTKESHQLSSCRPSCSGSGIDGGVRRGRVLHGWLVFAEVRDWCVAHIQPYDWPTSAICVLK